MPFLANPGASLIIDRQSIEERVTEFLKKIQISNALLEKIYNFCQSQAVDLDPNMLATIRLLHDKARIYFNERSNCPGAVFIGIESAVAYDINQTIVMLHRAFSFMVTNKFQALSELLHHKDNLAIIRRIDAGLYQRFIDLKNKLPAINLHPTLDASNIAKHIMTKAQQLIDQGKISNQDYDFLINLAVYFHERNAKGYSIFHKRNGIDERARNIARLIDYMEAGDMDAQREFLSNCHEMRGVLSQRLYDLLQPQIARVAVVQSPDGRLGIATEMRSIR